MGSFDASYQIRARLRPRSIEGIEVKEGETATLTSEGAPTIEEIKTEVKAALEARWPDFMASVTAERLDRD